MKKFSRLGVVAVSSAIALSGVSAVVIASPANAAACTGTVAIVAPLTGPVAFIGVEQDNFAKLAIADYNAAHGTTFVAKDYDTQLDAAQASTQAPNIVADKTTIGVVGPAGSQEVLAIGGLLGANNIALVSSSATRTNLTAGTFPSFFRVVPNDGAQGPGDADYMVKTLKAKNVAVIEEKTAYGTGLASAVMDQLKKLKVTATKFSVNEKNADYASVVTRVSKSADFVFVTFQDASKSQTVAQELIKQKKKAVVFGSDGSDQPTFKTKGAYLSSFAPDIKGIPADASIIKAYSTAYNKTAADITTFGPPTYAAAQVIVEAAGRACAAGKTADAANTLAEIAKTNIKKSILGGPLSFTTTGDVKGGRFYVYQIQADGSRKLIG
jgi:branched-chain amino acid transport system substrate-binding protein